VSADQSPSPDAELFRHALAALAYRAGKAMRGAPEGFAGFRSSDTSRTPGQILAHMGDLMDWTVTILRGAQAWKDTPPRAWDQEVRRFYDSLGAVDAQLAGASPEHALLQRLVQGPLADAFTHVGQLTMLRRLAGSPVRGENYFIAEIVPGRVGPDQAAPRKEFG
jgi:hypothetical protein